ncbi:TPA: hypothetical protein HA241_02245 [Candidatus Woesearchaeota archaeon]|uniref:Uncharacterized protein n=1 Tax=Candidatus Amesbacteria bacterium GW2011_GWA2_42_12 TaxID=1618356 RepID=A0A0G1AZF7_9BACT|nr:MAG: hypothetical protein UU93_C0034G0010 [Candidatus Amesbacteria bacterium GW2011_GWA2_42_12]HIH10983.1 hypothetical protein [Candidatus Woesearchaeota archaeon]
MVETTGADYARARYAVETAVTKEKEYYANVAKRINGSDDFLIKLWKRVNKFVLGAPLVTPEVVESVATTGKLPPLDLTNLKGPTGIIGAEMAVGGGIGLAAYLTALAAAGIVVPIVGSISAVAAGLTVVGLYKVVRFRRDHETTIEHLIKDMLGSDKAEREKKQLTQRVYAEEIAEISAYRSAEKLFQRAGFIEQGKVFGEMLTTIHNYAVVQRSVESQPDMSRERWTDEQRKAAFIINYLEQKGVIKRRAKKNGYFEPGESYRVSDRYIRQYEESEDLAKKMLAYIAYAEKEYGKEKTIKRGNS